jgi:hypothetical protein
MLSVARVPPTPAPRPPIATPSERYSGLDVVIDGANDLAFGAMAFEGVEQLLQQHVGG